MKRFTQGFFRLKIWLILPVFLLPLFISSPAALAKDHFLQELDIHVLLAKDGSARITERRAAVLNQDTENFIVIGNLGKSTIRDFTVQEDGRVYTYLEKWDIKASREEKAYKNGIVFKDGQYELCWGIGAYGAHIYEISYTVTDFIKQLDDAQILFWRFVNDQTNIPPRQVNVTIETAGQNLAGSGEDIWAFGFTGLTDYQDGRYLVSSERALRDKDYVTILIRLPRTAFATEDILPLSFAVIKEQALEGSSYLDQDKNKTGSKDGLPVVLSLLVIFLFPGLIFGKFALEKKRLANLRQQYAGQYWHNPPFQGDPAQIYALLKRDHQANFERLLTSYIMQWLLKGIISFEQLKPAGFLTKEKTLIRLAPAYKAASLLEAELYAVFQEACGDSLQADQKQLAAVMRKKRAQLQDWPIRAEESSRQFLLENGFINSPAKKLHLTHQGTDLNGKLFMFANYLQDFSPDQEQEAYSRQIMDELMLWAVLLGFSDAFSKRYQSFFPAFYASSFYTPETYVWARTLSSSIVSAGSSSSSSSGGGGGSYGGGSGGGTR